MSAALLQRVRRYIGRHQLWLPGGGVVAAVSGGSDSVALLWILRDLHQDGAVHLAGVAHLNHQLRAHAGRDEAFCRALAERLGVPFRAERADVAGLAREWRCSTEVAARRARYAFLEAARVHCGASHIGVAHTRDDQAETVLLRLVRGAGTRGLRGALPVRGAVVRPLLDCSRHELRAYLTARAEPWLEDETNADLGHPRNRVRHELLPLLAGHYRPSVARVLARTADVAAHDDALLERLAEQALSAVVATEPAAVRLDVAALAALPLSLQRRVARRALVVAGAGRAPGHGDIERLLDVCAAGGPAATEAAGVRVERFSADAVLLTRGSRAQADIPWPDRLLPVPGEVELPELGPECRVAAVGPIQQEGVLGPSGVRVALKAAAVELPLVVRSRRPGDRIQSVGLGGTKTLQDLLVDRKVPRGARNRIPVVADAAGRLVWVVGHAVAAHAAASPQDDVIVLSFEQPAPSGSEAS